MPRFKSLPLPTPKEMGFLFLLLFHLSPYQVVGSSSSCACCCVRPSFSTFVLFSFGSILLPNEQDLDYIFESFFYRFFSPFISRIPASGEPDLELLSTKPTKTKSS